MSKSHDPKIDVGFLLKSTQIDHLKSLQGVRQSFTKPRDPRLLSPSQFVTSVCIQDAKNQASNQLVSWKQVFMMLLLLLMMMMMMMMMMFKPTTKISMPLEKGPSSKEMSSSNHQFSFQGICYSFQAGIISGCFSHTRESERRSFVPKRQGSTTTVEKHWS